MPPKIVQIKHWLWRLRWGIVVTTACLLFLYSYVNFGDIGAVTKGHEYLSSTLIFHGPAFVEQNFETLNESDSDLIEYVRTRYLIPPVPKTMPYNFNNPKSDKRTEQSQWVRKFLKDQKNGVFIEAGANEGESYSHTLDLEMDLGWTGILIECNPIVTPYLRSKKRKSWVAGVCISTTGKAGVFNFSNPEKWTYSGGFGPSTLPVKANWTYFDVEAVPFYSILAAVGITEIDFFSFDVEGMEMQILETFPFDKITIKLMIVEVAFLEKTNFETFMHSKGFFTVEKWKYDYIFAHKKYHSPKNAELILDHVKGTPDASITSSNVPSASPFEAAAVRLNLAELIKKLASKSSGLNK